MQEVKYKLLMSINTILSAILYMMRNSVLLLISVYRLFISPLLSSVCMYEISCSRYAMKVFKEETFFKAVILSVKRILSCHPWNKNLY